MAATLFPPTTGLGGVSVSGTASSGEVLTATSAKAATWQAPSGGAPYTDTPSNWGYSSWTVPLINVNQTYQFGSNTYFFRFQATTSATVNHADILQYTVGTLTSLTAGLYTLTGTALALAPDIHTAWNAVNQVQTFTFASAVSLVAGTFYVFAINPEISAGLPSIGAYGVTLGSSAFSTGLNLNQTNPNFECAINGTQTTVPASFVYSDLTLGGFSKFWAGFR